jgi:cytoskeleton protein RodZ
MVAAAVSQIEDKQTSGGSRGSSISQADLKALFRQAELDLYRSKVFRHTLETLQEAPEQVDDVQGLLRQACKEAIRLALRQVFVSSWGMVEQLVHGRPTTETLIPQSIEPSDSNAQAIAPLPETDAEPSPMSELTLIHQAQDTPTVQKPVARPANVRGRRSKVRQTQQAQQAQQLLKREEVLRQLGQELKQVRELRSLSVAELHQQTHVPIHHIKAMEAGEVERLPEDIYVRGFVRQIGDALNLNGIAIANLIPTIDAATNPVPSWYHEQPGGDFYHLHLYAGYTALIAGTMGSLVLMNQQPFDPTAISQNLEWLNVFQPSENESSERFEVVPMMNGTGIDAIAPPDTSAPESSSSTDSFDQRSFVNRGDR